MIRFGVTFVAAFVSTTAAFAGDVYDFKIGGQSIHIEQPRNCDRPSCATISIPGIYESGPNSRRARASDNDLVAVSRDKQDIDTKSTSPAAASVAPKPSAPNVAAAPLKKSLEPANGVLNQPPAPAAGGLAAPTVAAIQPSPVSPVAASNTPTPVGVWLTEEKEGKVRIENCGGNLCGYAVDARTNANGDKVLINMKPAKDKWSGKIHDPDNGSSYDSTIALSGNDRLRVRGCAFGGMFCGGQTWTRVN